MSLRTVVHYATILGCAPDSANLCQAAWGHGSVDQGALERLGMQIGKERDEIHVSSEVVGPPV
jgi:hypothetical protein